MLEERISKPIADSTLFSLFSRYLEARHAEGGMNNMDYFDFSAMIEEAPAYTRVISYFEPESSGSGLVAACLTDLISDGLSLVYSFFDPSDPRRSFGTYMILHHVQMARKAGMRYVYLGYWIRGCAKMDYKSRFSGIELYYGNRWQKSADLTVPETGHETHDLRR